MTPTIPSTSQPDASRDEVMSALFATMVVQQAQMALMLLGHMPHPETGQTITDMEGAQMFIEQLEMLEVKTRGNLSKEEEQLLKESLAGTRMAFVQTMESQGRPVTPTPAAPVVEQPQPAAPVPVAAGAAAEEESRKKFSKKY